MVEYDGPEPHVNAELDGKEQVIVEESAYGINSENIFKILKNEQDNLLCNKPISRSVWLNTSEFSDFPTFFRSSLPMETLRQEFDWVVKRKNTIMATLATFTIVLQFIEMEIAYDTKTYLYRAASLPITIIKGFQTIFTGILLYNIYDYYAYQVAYLKKNWYILLYEGLRPGDLPQSIWRSPLRLRFILEVFLLAIHVPPYCDIPYWKQDPDGTTANHDVLLPFVPDFVGGFMTLRLYLWIRVIRDYSAIYSRRRLIYSGGYKGRGGPDLNYVIACKQIYVKKEAAAVATISVYGIILLTYMTWVTERHLQPLTFTLTNSFWFAMWQTMLGGFQDMMPLSRFGQLISLMCLFFGITMLSMFIALVFNAMKLDPTQEYAVGWMREYAITETQTNAATDYISHWWRYMSVKRGEDNEEARIKANRHYGDALARFNKMAEIITCSKNNEMKGLEIPPLK